MVLSYPKGERSLWVSFPSSLVETNRGIIRIVAHEAAGMACGAFAECWREDGWMTHHSHCLIYFPVPLQPHAWLPMIATKEEKGTIKSLNMTYNT